MSNGEYRARKFAKIWRMKRTICAIFGALILTGCVTSQRAVFYQLNKFEDLKSKTLRRMLWENDIDPSKNLTSSIILRGDLASYHLIQVRGSEKKHVHQFHDLAVFVQSGRGVMHLGKRQFKATAGSVIFIPHGTPHWFVNGGGDPAVAIAIFSPAYDGKDYVERE